MNGSANGVFECVGDNAQWQGGSWNDVAWNDPAARADDTPSERLKYPSYGSLPSDVTNDDVPMT